MLELEFARDAAAATMFGDLRGSCGDVFRGATSECEGVDDGAEYGLKGELEDIFEALLPERSEE